MQSFTAVWGPTLRPAAVQTNLFTLVRVVVMVIMCSKMFNYVENLTIDAKLHYFDKIESVNNTYLYLLSTASQSTTCLLSPTIERPDLITTLFWGCTYTQPGYLLAKWIAA